MARLQVLAGGEVRQNVLTTLSSPTIMRRRGDVMRAHQDPATHGNNYTPEQEQQDRDVHERGDHGYPDWAYQTYIDRHGHPPAPHSDDNRNGNG